MRAMVVLAALLGLSGCGQSVAVPHGECHMQALAAKVADGKDRIEFVDACMIARGYEVKTGLDDPFCTSAGGVVRLPNCYRRTATWERIQALWN